MGCWPFKVSSGGFRVLGPMGVEGGGEQAAGGEQNAGFTSLSSNSGAPYRLHDSDMLLNVPAPGFLTCKTGIIPPSWVNI